MKIHQLFHAIIDKFIPLDEKSRIDLQTEATNKYGKIEDEITAININNERAVKLNSDNIDNPEWEQMQLQGFALRHKIVKFLNSWWMRYVIALMFIYLVPKIKAYINGENSQTDEDYHDEDDDNDEDDFEMYKEFKRKQKRK